MRHGWTLDATTWERMREVVGDTLWHRVLLRPLYRDEVPESPGIYAICYGVKDPQQEPFTMLYDVVYVGQAADLRLRFLQHCGKPKRELRDAERCIGGIADYWYAEAPLERIGDIEAWLIKCLGPPANVISGVIVIPAEVREARRA